MFLTVSQYPQESVMSKPFIKKVAGYWLIETRLRHSCFPLDCVKHFKNTCFEEPLQVAVNNDSINTIICFLKINHLPLQG